MNGSAPNTCCTSKLILSVAPLPLEFLSDKRQKFGLLDDPAVILFGNELAQQIEFRNA